MGTEKDIVYVEPADFFPKELREKYKIGEFAEDEAEEKTDDQSITEAEQDG